MAFRWQSRLGITLAVDDRTRQPLTQARRNLAELGHGADATGGAFGRMNRELGRTAASLHAIERAFDVTKLAKTQAFRLDRSLSNVAIQIGGTAEQAQAMGDTVLRLANATGASVEQVGGLAVALADTGQQLEASDEQLVNLVRHFRMSAESAAMFRKQAGQLGTSVALLTEKTVQLQDNFNIPGMLAELPKVTDFAQRMFGQFSRSVLGNERRLIEQTLETGAVLASAFGKPFSRALDDAQQSMEFLAQTANHDIRFFMGFERELSGLSQTLAMFMGPRVDEAFRARSQGPIAFAGRLRHELARMKLQNSYFAQAFASELQRNLPEALRRLVFNDEVWADALEAQRVAQEHARVAQEHARGSIGEGATSFDKMTSALSSVGSTAIETFENLLTLGKTFVGLTFADDVGDIFTTVNEKLKEFNSYILDLANNLKDNERFKRFREGLRSVGPVVVGIAKGIGVLGGALTALSALTGLWRPMRYGIRTVGSALDMLTRPLLFLPRLVTKAVGSVITRLPGTFRTAFAFMARDARRFAGRGGVISRVIGNVGARMAVLTGKITGGGLSRIINTFSKVSIGGLAKSAFSAVLAFKSIGVGLNEFGKVLKDPNKTGLEKFKGAVRATFTGIGDFADTILLGIPSMITQAFGLGTFKEAMAGWGEDLANFFTADGPSKIGAALTSFKQWITGEIRSAAGVLSSDEFLASVRSAGENIGTAIGWALKQITDPENWKALWSRVSGFFSGSEARDPLLDSIRGLFSSVWNVVKEFGTSLGSAILEQLGTSVDEMKGVFTDLWTMFSEKAENAFNALKPLIMATILRPMALVNDKAAATLAQWEEEQRRKADQQRELEEAQARAHMRQVALGRIEEYRSSLANQTQFYMGGKAGDTLERKQQELDYLENILKTETDPGRVEWASQMLDQMTRLSSPEEAMARITQHRKRINRLWHVAFTTNDAALREQTLYDDQLMNRLEQQLIDALRTPDMRDDARVLRFIRDEIPLLDMHARRAPPEVAKAAGSAPAAPSSAEPVVMAQAVASTVRQALTHLNAVARVELGPRASELFTQQRNNDDRRGLGE